MQTFGKVSGLVVACVFAFVLALAMPRGLPVFPGVGPDHRNGTSSTADEDQPVIRPPDDGPRVDARSGTQELAGMRVQVMRVWLETDFHDGINWRQTTQPMLKVRLRYECLPPHKEIKFRNSDEVTAASAVYDDQNRKCAGKPWSYAPTYFSLSWPAIRLRPPSTSRPPSPGFPVWTLITPPSFWTRASHSDSTFPPTWSGRRRSPDSQPVASVYPPPTKMPLRKTGCKA